MKTQYVYVRFEVVAETAPEAKSYVQPYIEMLGVTGVSIVPCTEALEGIASMCETLVQRPAGYNGSPEMYGSFQSVMTGNECAAEIRKLI